MQRVTSVGTPWFTVGSLFLLIIIYEVIVISFSPRSKRTSRIDNLNFVANYFKCAKTDWANGTR